MNKKTIKKKTIEKKTIEKKNVKRTKPELKYKVNKKIARLSPKNIALKAESYRGFISGLAKEFGVSFRKAWIYMEKHDEVRKNYIDNPLFDLAEKIVAEAIKGGDANLALKYLERKGKDRGYGLIENENGGDNVTFKITIPEDLRETDTKTKDLREIDTKTKEDKE